MLNTLVGAGERQSGVLCRPLHRRVLLVRVADERPRALDARLAGALRRNGRDHHRRMAVVEAGDRQGRRACRPAALRGPPRARCANPEPVMTRVLSRRLV